MTIFPDLKNYFALAQDVLLKPCSGVNLPRHVQVEVTNYCNMNCLSCGRRYIVNKPQHMDFVTFIKIYNEIKPSNINLSGLGEPLLNPDIFKMIRYCKENDSIVNFPTNLNVPGEIIAKLVDAGPQQIKVSIDAATSETYKVVRQKDSFKKIVNNIKYINTLKEKEHTRYPEIRFNFALQKRNIDEIPYLLSLASDLKVKTVYVQDLNYFSIEEEKKKLCGIDKHYLKAMLQQCAKIAREKKINSNISNLLRQFEALYNKMLPKLQFEPNSILCNFPWVSTFIDVDGNVKPCPVFVWHGDPFSLGNCLEEPFIQIWNGEKYRSLRQSFKQNKRECAICRRCVPPNLFDMKLIFQKMLLRS
jgi:radical SAM protein with 4Fe4S-binding SPASM domain